MKVLTCLVWLNCCYYTCFDSCKDNSLKSENLIWGSIYDQNLNYSYTVIKCSASHNNAWIENQNKPILHPLGILTMNQSKALKVTQNNGDPGLLSSASKTSYTNIICTLLDSCNFVLQEFSFDGSGKRVLWQSFDLSEDTPLYQE